MRISRSLQLYPENASVHLYWRCHNKEFYLSNPRNKALYMQAIRDGLSHSTIKDRVKVHAFCVMNNHYHQSTSYSESSLFLSTYMRYTHGLFGSRYNRSHKRSGKVAESRPKTSLIQDVTHEMRVHFYIEANPIRAGFCKLENLKLYKYSSFKFYAYGIKDELSALIEIPNWYEELGETSKQRQFQYRRLFRKYLEETGESRTEKDLYKKVFIGSLLWISKQELRIKSFKTKDST